MTMTPALCSMPTFLRTSAPNKSEIPIPPSPGAHFFPTSPHPCSWDAPYRLPPRGPAHRRASALSAYSMSWLKQPQKGQRVSNTEPNCMSSCNIHRREPTFDAILGKGSPLRPQPGQGGRRWGCDT